MSDTEVAVQAALSKLGCPYVWGATGPDQFDCSGLVQWAFKQAGINLTRTTYTQILEGDPVTGSPQRGDLVFPEAGHVMIALGGDQAVHAPDTGDVVKISNYWTAPIMVRRMGTNSGTPGSTQTSTQFQALGLADQGLGDHLPIYQDINNLNKSVKSLLGTVGSITDVIQALSSFFNVLTSEEGWLRILKVAGGVSFILMSFSVLGLEFIKQIV